MLELLHFLADYCGFLFVSGRFRFVDSRAESANGNAMIVLESSSVRLRFTRDRGQMFLDLQPREGKPAEWFPIGLLRRVLVGHDFRSEALDPLWAQFLEHSLHDVELRLSEPESAKDLVARIKEQGRLRAREL